MAQAIRRTQTVTQEPVDDTPTTARGQAVLTNVIWVLDGLLLILLAFRFVLALAGANPANAFANFIYTVSYPFVAPFFGLFSYHYHYGISRLEGYTLVAITVYLVAGWLLAALVNINRRA